MDNFVEELPYLTADLPGIGGRIKDDVTDFIVEEIPLYALSGEGTHVYFRVTKRGIPTPAAVDRIARHMDVPPMEIGFAGLKDAQALTTQYMSLEHADVRRLGEFHDEQVKLEIVSRHGNKLKSGHLRGNRFVIRIRGVAADKVSQAQAVLDVLGRRGVPNFFGPQRFGIRQDTARLGELLVRNDLDEFIASYLGRSQKGDPPDIKAARDAFDGGFYARALDRWPRHFANERRALSAYKKKKHAGPAAAAIDKRIKRLYVSAFQSEIFNEVLVRRIGTIDRVFVGDLAQKIDTGGVFPVEDAALEQPRAAAFEISATGPVVGYRGNLAGDNSASNDQETRTDTDNNNGVGVSPRFAQEVNPGGVEREVLAAHTVDLEDFRHVGALKVKGTRRALRFKLEHTSLLAGKDARGEFLELAFDAPSGCYATVVLREIMKVSATGEQ